MTTKKMTITKMTDTISYPYVLGISTVFADFLYELNIKYSYSGSDVLLRFDNKSQLRAFIRTARKVNNSATDIITDGIIRSLII